MASSDADKATMQSHIEDVGTKNGTSDYQDHDDDANCPNEVTAPEESAVAGGPVDEARPSSSRPTKASKPQPLAPLIVTQAAPRDGRAVMAMARYVKEGGVFSPEMMLQHAQQQRMADSTGTDKEQKQAYATAGDRKSKDKKKEKRPQHDKRTHAQLRAACSPIILARLPDERLYVWDGHHRVAAIYLGGRDCLLPEEYSIMRCNFKFAQTVSFATWFLTPFDPRTEIRVPEFGSFKNEVALLLKKKKRPEAEVIEYITKNKHLYTLPRSFESVADMVASLDLKSEY